MCLQISYGCKLVLTRPAADSTYAICLFLQHSWALAHHMAAFEQFICAICSQLATETFRSAVKRQWEADGTPAPTPARFQKPKHAERVPNINSETCKC